MAVYDILLISLHDRKWDDVFEAQIDILNGTKLFKLLYVLLYESIFDIKFNLR